MLDITNYIPVMRFQGAKRNHLNGSEQEGVTCDSGNDSCKSQTVKDAKLHLQVMKDK